MGERNAFLGRAANWIAHRLIALALRLPYRRRVVLMGRVMSGIGARAFGLNRRVRANLAIALPNLPESDVRRLCREVTDNIGRSTIETYSIKELTEISAALPLSGPGWEAMLAAKAEGRGIILVTAHFGNYAMARMALMARDFNVGTLYRAFNNPYFEASHRHINSAQGPSFARGKAGLAGLLRHLRDHKCIAIVADQHVWDGTILTFFDLPAATTTSPARMALKYNALLVPIYAIRKPDGFDFDILIEEPIPPATPEVMSQALNDSMERVIRAYPGQWLWTHRRWKLGPKKRHARENA
ncbi:MAG: lysophospholipid acyltransferase family protein [Pseudomonadota bacterium]